MSIMHSKMNCWCCLRLIASLVFGSSTKTSFVFWWKWTRQCMEVMKMFQKRFGHFVFRITHTWCLICSCVECTHGRWKQECQWTINALNFDFFPNVPLCAWNNMLGSMQYQVSCMLSDFSILQIARATIHLGQDNMVRQDNALFMEFQLLRTMDQVSRLDPGSYFHSAMLVTTSWSCFVPLGRHWFYSQSLLWSPVLVPSHPGMATFCPCQTHSLILTWFPWNCCINGVCCLDSTPLLQIMTLCALHSV